MKDLILKSLVDQCAEVLVAHPDYIHSHRLPEELCDHLWEKDSSFDPEEGFSYYIKDPEVYTSWKEFRRQVLSFFQKIKRIPTKAEQSSVIHELFTFMVQERNALYNSGKSLSEFETVTKRKMIQLKKEEGMDIETYWVGLFQEPFPEESAWDAFFVSSKESVKDEPTSLEEEMMYTEEEEISEDIYEEETEEEAIL